MQGSNLGPLCERHTLSCCAISLAPQSFHFPAPLFNNFFNLNTMIYKIHSYFKNSGSQCFNTNPVWLMSIIVPVSLLGSVLRMGRARAGFVSILQCLAFHGWHLPGVYFAMWMLKLQKRASKEQVLGTGQVCKLTLEISATVTSPPRSWKRMQGWALYSVLEVAKSLWR